jgi:hypothetical protein
VPSIIVNGVEIRRRSNNYVCFGDVVEPSLGSIAAGGSATGAN